MSEPEVLALLPNDVPANATRRLVVSAYSLTERSILTMLYGILFSVGLFGNLWVIYLLIGLIARKLSTASRQAQILILCLSLADTLVLISLPVLIVNFWVQDWKAGTIICKGYWTCENLNKVLSTYLLMVLSIYCFLSICHPQVADRWNKKNGAGIAIVLSVGLSIMLMTPLYIYSRHYILTLKSGPNFTIVADKCLFQPPDHIFQAFTIYTFVLCFCIPSMVETLCYVAVLRHVYRHISRMQRTSIPFWRVTRTALILMTFYFLCWAPYWTIFLYTYFAHLDGQSSGNMVLAYLLHALPYVNSAVNPTLYTYLNKSIRDSCQSRLSKTRESLESVRRTLVDRNNTVRLANEESKNMIDSELAKTDLIKHMELNGGEKLLKEAAV